MELGPLSSADVEFLASGIGATIQLFLMAALLSLPLGLAIGLVRAGQATTWTRIPRHLLAGYSAIFRGVPALVMILLVYYGPALYGIRFDPVVAVMIALVGYGSSSMGEIFRASIDSISAEQWLAARSVGMKYAQAMRYVIGPQAMRLSVPPSVGFGAHMLKATSLASVLGFVEVTRVGTILATRTHEPLPMFVIVGLIYLVLTAPIIALGERLERRLHFTT